MRKHTDSPRVSVIIRTRNEQAYIRKVLEQLSRQTFRDFEIIVVDDHSADATLDIASEYPCTIISLQDRSFSHPYSCNVGARASRGEILFFTNGHCIPVSETMLEDGLRNFSDLRVAGVFAIPIAHEDGTLADWIVNDSMAHTLGSVRFSVGGISRLLMGFGWNMFGISLLGTTNAMIRKDLWDNYPFNEAYNDGLGGEDADWARHHIRAGYAIIHDPRIRVRHSHHLRLKDIFWQLQNWRYMVTAERVPERQRKYF